MRLSPKQQMVVTALRSGALVQRVHDVGEPKAKLQDGSATISLDIRTFERLKTLGVIELQYAIDDVEFWDLADAHVMP